MSIKTLNIDIQYKSKELLEEALLRFDETLQTFVDNNPDCSIQVFEHNNNKLTIKSVFLKEHVN